MESESSACDSMRGLAGQVKIYISLQCMANYASSFACQPG